jgi:predicted ester cyclase
VILKWLSNLRVRFLLLVVLALLPALGLLILTASEQRDQAVELERRGARGLANLAAEDQERLIENARQLLIVLAGLPEIRAAGPECDQLLAALVNDFPQYANLGVIAPNGSVACSGISPPRGINLSSRSDIQGVFETGEFTVGEYETGGVTGRPVLNAAYPIRSDNGNVTSVVYAALDLANFGEFASASQLSPESILTVIDRNGTVLVRRPQDEVVVGQSLADDPVFETILQTASGGVIDGPGPDGTYLYAFSPLAGETYAAAYLVIAIPRSEILREPEAAFSRNLTRLGLVVLVVMVAAWVGGDLLARRSADAHKELVRRIYDAFTTGRVDLLDDVVDQGFVDHDPMPGQAPGLPGLKQAVGLFRAAFPDGEMVINELVAEADKVVARVTLHGTHTGDYFGRKGTGRTVTADGVEIFRVKGDRVCEGWSRFVLPAEETPERSPDQDATESPFTDPDPNGYAPVAEVVDEITPAKHDSSSRDT